MTDDLAMPVDTAAAALGRAWIDDEPWELLTDLTAIGSRMGGTDGEAAAAERVADAFESAGVRNVREEPFGMTAWHRGDSELELPGAGERTFGTVALPYSPSGTVEADLVDVGHGMPDEIDGTDVAGAIAVASTTTPPDSRFIHRMEKFGYAVDAGAVGFVFANHREGQLPPTGSLQFGDEAAAPAVGVSRETGAWLREFASNTPGESRRARLSVEARTEPATSRNVVGRLGPDTDTELLLLAHYDAHDIAEGALDNGCGIAAVVVAAGVLARAELPMGVRVVGLGSEEIGLLGAEQIAESVDRDGVHAVVNVDGAGRHRDLVALSHGSAATAEAAEAVSRATRQPIEPEPEPHPFSDQWPFVRSGIPAIQLQSDGDDRGRGWGHTAADTRDKVDDRNVREHGMLTALLVGELLARDLPRLEADDLAEAFRDAEFETGMRAAGLWPSGWE